MTLLSAPTGWSEMVYAPILNDSNDENMSQIQKNMLLMDSNNLCQRVSRKSVEEVEQVKKPCFVLDQVLSKDECKLMIDLSEKMGYEDADKFCYAYNDRFNDRLMSDDPKFTEIVWNRIKQHLPQTLSKDGRTLHLASINPRWRLCKYKPGHYFNKHVDGSFEDHKNKTKSYLTLIIYLNSQLDGEFEGGSTIFYDSRMELMTRKVTEPAGNALIFLQNDKHMLHGGEKVFKGVKYIMRSDIMYSKREELN